VAGLIGRIRKVARQGKTWIRRTVKEVTKDRLYDYSTPDSRADTAAYLLAYADNQRSSWLAKWETYEDYYDGEHDIQKQLAQENASGEMPDVPVVEDAYIHVESQIISSVPQHEFRGQDDDRDSEKARQRQFVVQYIMDNNDMATKNADNERRINVKGIAYWKVGYDDDQMMGPCRGRIFIKDIDAVNIVQDPIPWTLDECEYVDYVFPLHRMAAKRKYAKQLKEKNLNLDELGGVSEPLRAINPEITDANDDIIQVQEHWFKQPKAGSAKFTYMKDGREVTDTVEWEAGDIACTIVICDTEIQYIPKYWLKTGIRMYPFVAAMKVPELNSYYGKSEIKRIKKLIDAADRELAMVLLNDAFTGNDMIVVEEGALAPGYEEIKGEPGEIVRVNDNRQDGIRRLGGLGNNNLGLKDTVATLRDMIQQTAGNFDINQGGAPPANVNTLGGLIELKEQGASRLNKKLPKWTAAWERLARLCDYTALEFWDEKRVIWLGAKDEKAAAAPVGQDYVNMDRSKGPIRFEYSSKNMIMKRKGPDGSEEEYYPDVDVIISVGDGVTNSRSMTIQALQSIAGMNITPQNYKIVQELIDQLGLPNRKYLKEILENQYGQPTAAPADPNAPGQAAAGQDGGLTPEELQYLMDHPEMLAGMIKENPEVIPDITPEEAEAIRQNPAIVDEMMPQILAMMGAPADPVAADAGGAV
jgi:hypothetical protein